MNTDPVDEKRQAVLSSTRSHIGTSVDQIVKETSLPQDEVTSHVAELVKEGRLYERMGSEGVLEYLQYRPGRRYTSQDQMDSFNQFMHGCTNPVHVYGHGYVNPNTREGQRFLGEG